MLIENSGLACRQARFRLFREVKCCVIVYYYWKGVAFLFFLFSLGRKIGFLGSRDFGYIKGGVGVFFSNSLSLSLRCASLCLSLRCAMSFPSMCYVSSFNVLCLFLRCAMSLPPMPLCLSLRCAPLSLSLICLLILGLILLSSLSLFLSLSSPPM